MDAKELRIGNWVSYNGIIGKVGQISQTNVGIITSPLIRSWVLRTFTQCDPIPLTPEILEASGFEQSISYYTKDDVWIDKNDMTVYLLVCPTENEINVKVEYLHQLQNLIFALTGEELDVKLPN